MNFKTIRISACELVPAIKSIKDEAWGQRRFGIIDPNGLYIDIVEQIEPEEGFWEQYLPDNYLI